MGLNNRGTVKECNRLPFLVTFLNLALIYCHIPFNSLGEGGVEMDQAVEIRYWRSNL